MNKAKLESVMKLNGDTQESLAFAVGLSRCSLNAKINNRNASFTQPEILYIKNRYNLTPEDINSIFFDTNVS